jgi:hypothetical protein
LYLGFQVQTKDQVDRAAICNELLKTVVTKGCPDTMNIKNQHGKRPQEACPFEDTKLLLQVQRIIMTAELRALITIGSAGRLAAFQNYVDEFKCLRLYM